MKPNVIDQFMVTVEGEPIEFSQIKNMGIFDSVRRLIRKRYARKGVTVSVQCKSVSAHPIKIEVTESGECEEVRIITRQEDAQRPA